MIIICLLLLMPYNLTQCMENMVNIKNTTAEESEWLLPVTFVNSALYTQESSVPFLPTQEEHKILTPEDINSAVQSNATRDASRIIRTQPRSILETALAIHNGSHPFVKKRKLRVVRVMTQDKE